MNAFSKQKQAVKTVSISIMKKVEHVRIGTGFGGYLSGGTFSSIRNDLISEIFNSKTKHQTIINAFPPTKYCAVMLQ